MHSAIETVDLSKHFGKTRALDGINLCIQRGAVYGLLGPNGAGKTTTVRLLSTLLKPSSGSAKILGLDLVKDAAQIRAKVSLTGQFASVDEDLTGFENLVLIGRLLGHRWRDAKARAEELLEAFSLDEAGKRQARTYSGGMRRRLDIAASLVLTPEILFLDEPTSGLDPRSRNQVWDIVRAISAEGATVLLTTQYLEEADRLADRLAVIDRGKLIAEGTSRELKASVGSGALHIYLHNSEELDKAKNLLARFATAEVQLEAESGRLSVQVSDENQALAALETLKNAGIGLGEFSLGAPSLDDVFFALTGKAKEDQAKESLHEETSV